MNIKIKKLYPDAVLPTYAHGSESDAGMDLYAQEDAQLPYDVPTLVKTGVAIELPPYYEAQVRSRSGLALKNGVHVFNSPGTVDPAYRGELGVILLWNGHITEMKLIPDRFLQISKGDRIAQLVVTKYEPVYWTEVDELGESDRGEGGYGSTGVHS